MATEDQQAILQVLRALSAISSLFHQAAQRESCHLGKIVRNTAFRLLLAHLIKAAPQKAIPFANPFYCREYTLGDRKAFGIDCLSLRR